MTFLDQNVEQQLTIILKIHKYRKETMQVE